ncbi:hypothetical protein K443DRAFT_11659 [Laccaria amethystina LaAM-08-1]|uniref:Uncharacterized protein n=1 Tax=Laccaria amethystina LaAM-08-1 TaxID=1095629 RepID=A0A0C9XG05_9AGAR|nr:hypothetical protein K443DRAFT_11659 [Laccaria amethystina LaAM-08-1]
MAHDNNNVVTPRHRLLNEHPPRQQPMVAPTQLNATSGGEARITMTTLPSPSECAEGTATVIRPFPLPL